MKWTLVLLILCPIIKFCWSTIPKPYPAKHLDWRSCGFRKYALPCHKLDWRKCAYSKCIKSKNRYKRQFLDAGGYPGMMGLPGGLGFPGGMGLPGGMPFSGGMGLPGGMGFQGSMGLPWGMGFPGGMGFSGGIERPCKNRPSCNCHSRTRLPAESNNYGSCPAGYKLCACKICNKRLKPICNKNAKR